MRIAFDIDDTLVLPHGHGSEPAPWPWRLVYRERLRQGAKELLRELSEQGHEVWIYTTSLRNPRYIKGWLKRFGVRIADVVNQTRHERTLRDREPAVRSVSKYPPAFGIDVLVDDEPGVEQEGRALGFTVVQVKPDDANWTQAVRLFITTTQAPKP